jgi:hypothetical protein
MVHPGESMSNDELSEFHFLEWSGSRDREGISPAHHANISPVGRALWCNQDKGSMGTSPTQASYFE